jgi:hypothetical protein
VVVRPKELVLAALVALGVVVCLVELLEVLDRVHMATSTRADLDRLPETPAGSPDDGGNEA